MQFTKGQCDSILVDSLVDHETGMRKCLKMRFPTSRISPFCQAPTTSVSVPSAGRAWRVSPMPAISAAPAVPSFSTSMQAQRRTCAVWFSAAPTKRTFASKGSNNGRRSHRPAFARLAGLHHHRDVGLLYEGVPALRDIPFADRIPVVRELIVGRVGTERARGAFAMAGGPAAANGTAKVSAMPTSMGSTLRANGRSARANTNRSTGRTQGPRIVSTPPRWARIGLKHAGDILGGLAPKQVRVWSFTSGF
jgi:hypothetical protein